MSQRCSQQRDSVSFRRKNYAKDDYLIRTFAESGAAGVIGTEVKVWKPLATFVAERFFDAFLARQPVGQILRDLRHELLRRYNPLGLIYTNYCSADLKSEKPGI